MLTWYAILSLPYCHCAVFLSRSIRLPRFSFSLETTVTTARCTYWQRQTALISHAYGKVFCLAVLSVHGNHWFVSSSCGSFAIRVFYLSRSVLDFCSRRWWTLCRQKGLSFLSFFGNLRNFDLWSYSLDTVNIRIIIIIIYYTGCLCMRLSKIPG